ncbi:MAG: tRNA (adenosine(37)-N6)-dimethylallyltransferase MiaA [Candidatus Gastranaerophilales bacterium]|nr:tRNA (adenosine(37)-N6)-dimethylallyltransferase MiaA [Candidatus Gastranaerophilales bacterium]
MKKSNNVIAIIGPTATGKSDLAIELALSFNTEIISADSRLVYKDFNIGTAKPTMEELNKVKHYCVDIASPLDDFSVSDFKQEATQAIEKLHNKNKPAIIAGGTGFYVKSLLEGLEIPHVPADEDFRQKMRKLAEEKGNEYLYNILKEKDKETADKLHANDVFRVIRALEVMDKLNVKMSVAQNKNKPDYNIIYIFLDAKDRKYLYNRINKRVEIMLELGLVEEVKELINKYGKTVSLLKTLGYKEVSSYLDNEISYEDMVELIKKNTRNFAKRQLTWFRAVEDTNKFYIDEFDKNEILVKVKEKCLSMM